MDGVQISPKFIISIVNSFINFINTVQYILFFRLTFKISNVLYEVYFLNKVTCTDTYKYGWAKSVIFKTLTDTDLTYFWNFL